MISAIPTAIDALVAAVRALPGYGEPGPLLGEDVLVVDGGADTRDVDAARQVVIGSSVTPFLAASVDAARSYAVGSRAETFDIACAALTWTGDADAAVPGLRAAAFALVDPIDALLQADRSLGDVVVDARIFTVGYRVAVDPLAVQVPFTVRVVAISAI